MRRLVLRQRYFTDICSIAVVTLALFQRSVMGLKKRGKQIKRQMRCLELRQRYFTDICIIAVVVTLALFQRSVMDLKNAGNKYKQNNLRYSTRQPSYLPTPAPHPQASVSPPPFGSRRGGDTLPRGGRGAN
jgi:hypothetical protein